MFFFCVLHTLFSYLIYKLLAITSKMNNLPVEILEMIFEQLDIQSLKNIFRYSRYHVSSTTFRFYKRMCVPIWQKQLKTLMRIRDTNNRNTFYYEMYRSRYNSVTYEPKVNASSFSFGPGISCDSRYFYNNEIVRTFNIRDRKMNKKIQELLKLISKHQT